LLLAGCISTALLFFGGALPARGGFEIVTTGVAAGPDPPDPAGTPAALPTSILATTQIVSFYGNPHTADMGIVGELDPETLADQVQGAAKLLDALNGDDLGAVAAIHLVAVVAQRDAASSGVFVQRLADEQIERYLQLAEDRNMLLFLDVQPGRSTVTEEVLRLARYLRNPRVHLALDPEFAWSPEEKPGEDIGSLSGSQINEAQTILSELVRRDNLPPKILVVHQFRDDMLTQTAAIRRYPGVDLVLDMDGFGPADIKKVKYDRYAYQPWVRYGAIKLFFKYDPDMMGLDDVLALAPRPAIVIYQ